MPESRMTGSSPLARGLLGAVAARDLYSGIIPARAGFTSTEYQTGRKRSDHPRSRGVYMPSMVSRRDAEGSSPLARGLLGPVAAGDLDAGIIPARAGFTLRGSGAEQIVPDHPRSRGVYIKTRGSGTAVEGSSPLARGLPRGSCHFRVP